MVQGQLFGKVFALVFIRSFDRAERVHKAMIARGYSGSYVAGTGVPGPGLSGYVVLCMLVLAIIIVMRITPDAAGVV
jgi:cobalt/nickel transport system permease protein